MEVESVPRRMWNLAISMQSISPMLMNSTLMSANSSDSTHQEKSTYQNWINFSSTTELFANPATNGIARPLRTWSYRLWQKSGADLSAIATRRVNVSLEIGNDASANAGSALVQGMPRLPIPPAQSEPQY